MNPDFAREVIDQSSYGSLALYDPDKKQTYSVNLSLVRLGDCSTSTLPRPATSWTF